MPGETWDVFAMALLHWSLHRNHCNKSKQPFLPPSKEELPEVKKTLENFCTLGISGSHKIKSFIGGQQHQSQMLPKTVAWFCRFFLGGSKWQRNEREFLGNEKTLRPAKWLTSIGLKFCKKSRVHWLVITLPIQDWKKSWKTSSHTCLKYIGHSFSKS